MGIKGIKKRVSCFMLAFSLSFGICAADYLEVQALEWAGTVIGLEEALKFLLGLIGVTVGVGVAENVDWQSMRENCVDFQIAQGQSAVAVSNWWADVIRGSLDTASSCWASFKDWVQNELLTGSTSSNLSIDSAIKSVNPNYNVTGDISNFIFDHAFYYQSTSTYFYFFNGVTMKSRNSYIDVYPIDSSFTYVSFSLPLSGGGTASNVTVNLHQGTWTLAVQGSTVPVYGDLTSNANPSKYIAWDIGATDIPSESDFDSAFSNIQDIALAPDTATDIPVDGVISIPWENVGATDEAVGEAIDSAQEKVITGEWTLDQYWSWVQNVTNVFAYDITNNYLLPNDGNNESADDKVQENVNRGAFVLAGLEKVFPFCIPWDIYSFVTLLVAVPVAPVIEYPIYNPVTKDEEVIIIDFSVWEQQVIIMRYIMDFLLIIGLLLLARSLIGAGGSD